MKNMRKIQVLMSTYNGERYLEKQLESILQQDCADKGIADFSLLIRDDGSEDGTQKLLEKYSIMMPEKVKWYTGENKGVIGSFFDLLEKSDDVDYLAFSDQDDYWLPDKLSAGVNKIIEKEKKGKKPVLYGCRPMLVDENLNEINSNIKRPIVKTGFGNALIENVITGCTAIMNKELKNVILKQLPEYTVMHDWWFYLMASYFGEVLYDEQMYILYRQHGDNVMGSATKHTIELKNRIKSWKRNSHKISRQAKEFKKVVDIIEGDNVVCEKKELLQSLVNGKKELLTRIRLISQGKLFRQRKNDNRIFKVLIVLNIY